MLNVIIFRLESRGFAAQAVMEVMQKMRGPRIFCITSI